MDHKDVIQRQFKFYQEIKKKAEAFLGKSSPHLQRYKKVYHSELLKLKPKKSTNLDFFKSLTKTDVLIFGDFHSEPQSIRSLLRICRKLKTSELALGLECVQFAHQDILNQFMAGEISEKDFIKLTDWDKNWDFPFDFVKPLFHWANLNSVPLFGINKSAVSLSVRDKKIAQNIKAIKNQEPKRLLIVQLGDYHTASKHVKSELKKNSPALKVQTVFQSPDELYFRWMATQKVVPDFIRLGRDLWAVMAVLPWVKWQNYLLWLENSGTYQMIDPEHEIDMTDHIARFVKFLSDAVHLPTDVSEVSIYALTDVNRTTEFKNLDTKVRSKIKKDIEDQKSFFVPELQKGYIQNFSLNHVCKLATEYFLYKNNIYKKTISDPQKQFISLIWIEMLTYFLIKIINPKRKTNTVFDMRSFLMSENFDDHGKDVLSIALEQKLREMNSQIATGPKLKSTRKTTGHLHNPKSYASAARLLGGILGEKVFWAYSNKRLKFPQGDKFLFQDVYHKSFHIRYYDLIEVIDHWPTVAGAKSKFDQF